MRLQQKSVKPQLAAHLDTPLSRPSYTPEQKYLQATFNSATQTFDNEMASEKGPVEPSPPLLALAEWLHGKCSRVKLTELFLGSANHESMQAFLSRWFCSISRRSFTEVLNKSDSIVKLVPLSLFNPLAHLSTIYLRASITGTSIICNTNCLPMDIEHGNVDDWPISPGSSRSSAPVRPQTPSRCF